MDTDFAVSVIGLGYVGLPLALSFAEAGEAVLGLDVDEHKLGILLAGNTYIQHIPSSRIASALSSKKFEPSGDFSLVSRSRAVIICVPTPLTQQREPDLSYVLDTGRAVAPYLKPGVLVVLESTTYPGTTDGELRRVLELGSKLAAGTDFHLAFSPERVDPANPSSVLRSIPKVVGGFTSACLQRALALYGAVVDRPVAVSSCRAAEATKILENTYRAVNIALVNELKIVYTAMGIDIWEVIEAAKTKPFGFTPFYPGPGLGGHCIPIDPFYLTWKAREFGKHTRFIELAGEVNTAMPEYVISVAIKALNTVKKPMNGASVLLLGLAYKPNVDDCRESPAFILLEKLEEMQAAVSYNDPHIPVIPPTREHARYRGRTSVRVQESGFDLAILCTHHYEYTEMDFSSWAIPLLDSRNAVSATRRPRMYWKC